MGGFAGGYAGNRAFPTRAQWSQMQRGGAGGAGVAGAAVARRTFDPANVVAAPRSGGQGLGPGTLSARAIAEIQAIVEEFNTIVDVVGSRARGEGRFVDDPSVPIGKGEHLRSDIDFRIDTDHPRVDELILRLKAVDNGCGSAGPKWSTRPDMPRGHPTYPPFIRFRPGVPPELVRQ